MSRKPFHSIAIHLLRIVLGLGLLAFLFATIHLSEILASFQQALTHWEWMVFGLFLTFVGLFAGAVRWRAILLAQGIAMGAGTVARLFFIGQFFNAFMLGACGGDMARAYLVMRETSSHKPEVAASVFLDRAIGLFVLIVFCCVMIVCRIPLFLDHEGARAPGLLMLVFLGASILAIFALFQRNVFEHWAIFKALENRTRIGPLIRRAYDTFYFYQRSSQTMRTTFLLSLLNLVFLTLACWALGQSLQIQAGLLDYFTLFPIITVIAAAPLTPGSLGVREGLFVAMFQAIGVEGSQSILLSLLIYGAGTFWSLCGGLLFMLSPSRPLPSAASKSV